MKPTNPSVAMTRTSGFTLGACRGTATRPGARYVSPNETRRAASRGTSSRGSRATPPPDPAHRRGVGSRGARARFGSLLGGGRYTAEPGEHGLTPGLERLTHAAALGGDRFELRGAERVERRVQALERERRPEVALVVLEDPRDAGTLRRSVPERCELLLEVVERIAVGALARRVRVGHEHDPIRPGEYRAPRQPVVDLPRDGIEVEAGGEAVHLPEVHWQEVEEQRAIVVGGDRDQPAAALLGQALVEELEVGGLPPEPRAVIDDLEMDLTGAVVDERHFDSAMCRRE